MASSDVSDLTRRIKQTQRKLRRARGREDDWEQGVLSAQTARLTVMVFVFSGHSLDVAAEFLAFKRGCSEDMRSLVENVYMQESTPRIVELMNGACVETRRMRELATACLFIVQLQLFQWLCHQNCFCGVAPSRLQMVRKALSILPEDCPPPVLARVQRPLRGSPRKQRAWLQQFRQGFGARLGTLQQLPVFSLAEMQEKAGERSCSLVCWRCCFFELCV